MSRPYVRNTPNYVDNFASKPEKILTINAFAGGMNNVESDSVIDDNQSSDCANMMFVASSLMEKRFGTSIVDKITYPDIVDELLEGIPITWLDEYRPTTGDVEIVRATESAIYIGSNKICDVLGNVRGVNYIGKYYFVDGTYLYVYDGITYFQVCDTHSYTTSEASANATSIVVKDIPNHVTASNPLYFTTATGTVITLDITAVNRTTNTVTVNTGHTAIIPKETVVYFYTPLAISFVEGTEYFNETTHLAYYEPCLNQLNDAYAGTPYLPDSPTVVTVHKDRIFISGDTEQPHGVYMSAVSAISAIYFPSGAGVSAKPNGESIVDLVVFDSALIIGRHNDMYVLYGSSEYQEISSDPFNIKQMDVSIGFMCADCGSLINNYYIYLGYDGRFYRLNTPTTFVEYLMTKPLDWKINLYAEPFNLAVGTQLDVSSVTFYNEVYFNIGTDLVLIYNFDVQGWTYYKGWLGNSLYTDGLNLYIGRNDGKLVLFDKDGTNYNDIGEPIITKYHTKRFDFGSSANFKYFKRFMVSSSAFDDFNSTINVSLEIDLYDVDNIHTFSSNNSRFGSALWGLSFFNNKELVKSGWEMLDVEGRTIKFKFSNVNDNEPFRIYDVNLCYSFRDVR